MVSTARILSEAAGEVWFEQRSISLCLILNRRNRAVRIVDFRSGYNPDKWSFVLTVAQRERMQRVFTLVERDEVAAWERSGLQREGSVPGFFKRSDAWILGTLLETGSGETETEKSGMRLAPKASSRSRCAQPVDGVARRRAKALEGRPTPPVRIHPARHTERKNALTAAVRAGRALTRFEPFSRNIERYDLLCTARGGFSLLMSAEIQPCFNNAFLELLTAPRSEREAALTRVALRLLCDHLLQYDVVACFALSPADDECLALAYVASGFRRSGLLRSHLLRHHGRTDAFLWSRKLASSGDP